MTAEKNEIRFKPKKLMTQFEQQNEVSYVKWKQLRSSDAFFKQTNCIDWNTTESPRYRGVIVRLINALNWKFGLNFGTLVLCKEVILTGIIWN